MLNALEDLIGKTPHATGHYQPDQERLARMDLTAINDRIPVEPGSS